MPFIIALLGLAVAAYFWMNRARRGGEIAADLMDMGADVKNAARRFGFRRKANQHPVDSIDDPNLAIGGLAAAFLELDDLPTSDARAKMDISLRKHLKLTGEEAQEVAVLGRWFVETCGGASPAFERLAKKLRHLEGGASFEVLMGILNDCANASAQGASARQRDVLGDLARIFRTH